MQVSSSFDNEAREIRISPNKQLELIGNLVLPETARGLVVFAHGSGSSRHSPRNQKVAQKLRQDGRLGTLLFDLLTTDEELAELKTRHLRFDIDLLAERMQMTTRWLKARSEFAGRALSYFGASTGAAAALASAAELSDDVSAVVSRGGRPDLADRWLPRVLAPTLFIVGEYDQDVLKLNQSAASQLPASTPKELVVVPRASHLFEESGALDAVASHAREWFLKHGLYQR